ncbi:hypothetical protein [Amphibacillus cookii]|uniref:hypothetical protein n=1 Tax=Amphibacillus cookii TaxID=767787 RepID=UPI00195C8BFE|nr:hypothetical protein [Amphibacillus cookii]MBM7543256.1 hypothetical protein [Amphibacillus cookii]
MNLLQLTLDVIFGGYMPYLAPLLFLLMVILFVDRLIDFIYNAIGRQKERY